MRHMGRGFSLLEVLVAIALMSTAAMLALDSVSDQDNQNRFDITRSRVDAIRDAIVGEPQVINGSLQLNGFVADMGRLPANVDELFISPCSGTCDWAYNAESELWSGWNGPYIHAINNDYRDGWGNNTDDAFQGWGWNTDTPADNDLTIHSLGLDGIVNNGSEDYNDDALQSAIILSNEYQVDLPANSTQIAVDYLPYCGICSDDAFDSPDSCQTANGNWTTVRYYCVGYPAHDNKADCESATGTWQLISHCSDGVSTSQTSCEAGSGTWTVPASDSACNALLTNAKHFNASTEEACIKPIHPVDGVIATGPYRSKDGSPLTIQQGAVDNSYNDVTEMEQDQDSSPETQLILPQGQARFGLYYYDDNPLLDPTDRCTDKPFPSVAAQGRTDALTISPQYSRNLGTSGSPITFHWRDSE